MTEQNNEVIPETAVDPRMETAVGKMIDGISRAGVKFVQNSDVLGRIARKAGGNV